MILERLRLSDFRAYRGRHVIDLAPRVRYRAERPIVLFGGLNGAGKTTLMMAIKLALYGRHALGMGTPSSTYHRFLRDCVHSSSSSAPSRPKGAFVEIDFLYGKLGENSRYTVRRSWSTATSRVRESLSVSQDGKPLSLSPAACQGFLNDLVPIGVSELFFFDGEKIAELAEDETGRTLGDAIERLLGLHLVERLRNDLRVYTLRHDTNCNDDRAADEIERLQTDYEQLLGEIDAAHDELADSHQRLEALAAERDRLDMQLSERDGDWAVSRESLRADATSLNNAIQKSERQLRDEFAGLFPLTLAYDALMPALDAASTTLKARSQAEANEALTSFAAALKPHLDATATDQVDKLLDSAIQPVAHDYTLIDVSHHALGRMDQVVRHFIPEVRSRVDRLVRSIRNATSELEAITLRLDQSPDEAALSGEMDELADLGGEIADATVALAVRKRELKTRYRLAIEKARMLRNRHTELSTQLKAAQPLEYAERTRNLLRHFRPLKAQRKIAEIEHEFAAAFQELARKDDLVATAQVDARNFTVKLLNRRGLEIRKGQLSAGEKQIYAIAMLDALARTSGRRLPVVIDTPLGRLDSQHRSNLVTNYFPHASHQVILLSTDVEVDQPFFQALSPQVSHAFEIRYDTAQQASSIFEGYFWRPHARMAR